MKPEELDEAVEVLSARAEDERSFSPFADFIALLKADSARPLWQVIEVQTRFVRAITERMKSRGSGD